MMKSFRDPATGVLKAYGFADSNAPGDLVQDEVDNFSLEPGKWQLIAGTWTVYGQTTQLKVEAEAAIQNLLDSTARTHGYDNILSLCSYSNSTNLTWQKEGQYGCSYRDACWTKAQQIQTDATEGNWPTTGAGQTPTVYDVLAAMPAVAWPI